jgi:hypothetical protein
MIGGVVDMFGGRSCGYESVIGKEGKFGEGGGLCSREAGASGRFAWILGKVAVQCRCSAFDMGQ